MRMHVKKRSGSKKGSGSGLAIIQASFSLFPTHATCGSLSHSARANGRRSPASDTHTPDRPQRSPSPLVGSRGL